MSIVVERKKKKIGSRFKFSWIQISVTSWPYHPGQVTQTPSVSFFIYEMGITHSYQEHKMTSELHKVPRELLTQPGT